MNNVGASAQSQTTSPARIAWLIPSLIEGSGGHRTILQNIAALDARGHECHLYVQPDLPERDCSEASRQRIIRRLRSYFGYSGPDERVHMDYKIGQPVDMVFATAWHTAQVVRDIRQPCKKAYFVQDYEAWFMPMGDGFLAAERSYTYGLTPISIGHWLTRTLAHKYNCAGTWFEFCADLGVYKRDDTITRRPSVCFIHQPEKPRRCPALGIAALGIVKHHRPDVDIVLYGSRADTARVWFEHDNRGLISVDDCNRMYNECQVGLCISSSNPSRIPFEMMAAGLPVVDVHRENNLYDMPEGGVLLTRPRPEQLARGILALLDDNDRRERMGAFGQHFMENRALSSGFSQFVRAVEDVLAGNTQGWHARARAVETMYRRSPDLIDAPVISGNDAAAQAHQSQKMSQMIDMQMHARHELEQIEHSRAYTFFQRVKRAPMYAAFARARWGEDWARVDPNEDVARKLARVKNSRSYRMLMGAKRTGVYRMYAKRKWGEQASSNLK